MEELFLRAAALAPDQRFLLGGEGWGDKPMPPNVRYIGHVPTADHNRVNCSAGMVMNINRASMADFGFSPPTRVFEVAGAGTCLLCDDWPGIATASSPEREILVVRSAEDVAVRCTSTMRLPGAASAMPSMHAACATTPMRNARRRPTSPFASAARAAAAKRRRKPYRAGHDGRLGARAGLPRRRRLDAGAGRSRAHEDRDLWPDDHVVLGQRPRDNLSLALQGARAARPHASTSSRKMWSGTAAIATCPSRSSARCICMTIGRAAQIPCCVSAIGCRCDRHRLLLPRCDRCDAKRCSTAAWSAAVLRHRHADHAWRSCAPTGRRSTCRLA